MQKSSQGMMMADPTEDGGVGENGSDNAYTFLVKRISRVLEMD